MSERMPLTLMDILSIDALKDSIKPTLRDNWHALEYWSGITPTRWISNESTLDITSQDKISMKLLFTVMSFHEPRRMQVYLNEDLVLEKEIPTHFIKGSIPLELKVNKNNLKFLSIDGSERPIDIPPFQSSDQRSLSFAFQALEFIVFDKGKFNYRKFPLKINLGCGFDRRDGYLNVDFQGFHNPDLVADISNLSMLPSNTYEEILAQDVLEHLPIINIKITLEEWYRLLRVGGVLRLRIPDIVGLLHLLEDRQSVKGQEELIKCLFGTQAYNGDYHLSGFTSTLMEYYLKEIGFTNIIITSKDQWLIEITANKNLKISPVAD